MTLLDSYQNENEDDCVEASYRNAVNILTGRLGSDAAVQSLYRATGRGALWRWFWSRVIAGWTGLRMWQFKFTPFPDYRMRSFGKIAGNATALRAALIKYRAMIVGKGGHQVCLYMTGLQIKEADTVNGITDVPDLAAYAKNVDSACFAFTDRPFDWPLILTGMKNNWPLWTANFALVAIILYVLVRL